MMNRDPKQELSSTGSQNKRRFLTSPDQSSRQLSASDLKNLALYYQKKHGVKIYFNGATSLSQRMLAVTTRKMQSEIAAYQGDLRYYTYLKQFWQVPLQAGQAMLLSNPFMIVNHERSAFNAVYSALQQLLLPYLDSTSGALKDDLSDADKTQINECCQDAVARQIFDDCIKAQVGKLQKQRADLCLDKSMVVREVYRIQQSLKEDEIVGYIFTNGHQEEEDHFEVLILTKDKIIKPLTWGMQQDGLKSLNLDDFAQYFYSTDQLPYIVSPQTGHVECGTLGLMYLKELLKDKGKQLIEQSLCFSYINPEYPQKVRNLFFPSPQVLRYSQAKEYNQYLWALLDDQDVSSFSWEGKSYTFSTLRKILKDSITAAKKTGQEEIVSHNQKTLERLAAFKREWLAGYEIAIRKRETMTQEEHNFYLTYHTQKKKNFANISFFLRFHATEDFSLESNSYNKTPTPSQSKS